jgi:LPXTG-motif cell wall-anchored protein
MTGPGSATLSILMIAAFLLAAGGLYLILKRGERAKGALMILAGLVALGNVLVWTL